MNDHKIRAVILKKAGLALPFSWNFTNGLGRFSGSNLSIVGGKLVITPTLGDEMWDAPASVFTGAGTYAWVAQGTNTIANPANALVITYVNNANGASELLRDAADLNANLTIGIWYRFLCDIFVNAGTNLNVSFYDSDLIVSYSPNITSITPISIALSIKCIHATSSSVLIGGMGAGEIATLDNLSLKPITLATQLAGGLPASRSDVIVKAAWTQVTGLPCGVDACIDNYSNPQNLLRALHLGSINQKVMLLKLVNGTWTTLIAPTAANYVAGANTEIQKSGSSVILRYNGVQIGATQNVDNPSLMYNRLHTPFSTDPANVCQSFSIEAS